MTFDERDSRDRPPEEPDQAADEFETPSWPSQDIPADRPPDAAQRGEEPAPFADAPLAAEAPGEEPAPADEPLAPPPSDVEAYAAAPSRTPPGATLPAHSVPATEPGESTRCPRCGTENRPGIAFCRSCGQRLVAAGASTTVERPAAPEGTQVCPRCGTHNRAGVAFCQNCGANMRAHADAAGAAASVAPGAPLPAAERTAREEPAGGRALLGPIVLVIGAVFIAVAWLLPFPFGPGSSLSERAFGAEGYGVAFWNGYEGIGDLASQAYFGLAASAPILVLLLAILAVAGFLRPAPAVLQWIGLLVTLVWAVGLGLLFVLVEVLGGPGEDLVGILRNLTAGGIIFFLASLIVVIGTLTRFGRS